MNHPGLTSPTVRRRRSGAEVTALLSAFAQSGQTPREFCHQRQMPFSSFSSLLRRHAGQHSSPQSLPTRAPVGSGTASLLPVEIVKKRALLSVTKPSSLIVEVPGGFRITVDPDFDGNTLCRLVAALGSE
jgi:hypothetical protein